MSKPVDRAVFLIELLALTESRIREIKQMQITRGEKFSSDVLEINQKIRESVLVLMKRLRAMGVNV